MAPRSLPLPESGPPSGVMTRVISGALSVRLSCVVTWSRGPPRSGSSCPCRHPAATRRCSASQTVANRALRVERRRLQVADQACSLMFECRSITCISSSSRRHPPLAHRDSRPKDAHHPRGMIAAGPLLTTPDHPSRVMACVSAGRRARLGGTPAGLRPICVPARGYQGRYRCPAAVRLRRGRRGH